MMHMQFQFISDTLDKSLAYHGTYNIYLVILSVLMASLAAYSALLIIEKLIHVSDKNIKQTWLAIGALAMGVGIWSMHFVGMLAFNLPVAVSYDPLITMISLLPGILASRVALGFMLKEKIGFWRLNLGGILMGVGIGTMHYTGMYAMILNARMYYDPVWLTLSILVAHVLATFALFVKFVFSPEFIGGRKKLRILSSLLMGCAVAGMHYTGMKAAFYFPVTDVTHSAQISVGGINPSVLAFIVTGVAAIFIAVVIVGTFGNHERIMHVRFPLNFKISMGFGTLLIMFLLSQTIILSRIDNINKQIIATAESSDKITSIIEHLRETIIDIERNLAAFIKTSQEIFWESYLSGVAEFKKQIGEVRTFEHIDPSLKTALMEIEPLITLWHEELGPRIETTRRTPQTGAQTDDLKDILLESSKTLDVARKKMDAAIEQKRGLKNEAYQKTSQAVNKTIQLSYTLILFSIVLSVAIITLLMRGLINSLFKLISFSQSMKDGNMDSKIEISSWDEFQVLALTFEDMRKKLNAFYTRLKQSNEELKKSEAESLAMLSELRKTHSALKQAQMQAMQSEKMASIGQLAAGVAHEINNPVGFIGSNIQTLEEYIKSYSMILGAVEKLKHAVESGDNAKAKDTLQELKETEEKVNLNFITNDVNNLISESQRGIDRVKKIVLDLRTFSREDSEEMGWAHVEAIIDSVLSIVHNELKYKAEIKKDYAQTPQVKCHAQKLGQVFINLLVNASHAIEEKGIISIKTYQDHDNVCIDVSDTGKGISEENLKKIFDPFFTTKKIGTGTGLGLSISYEIIQKHGGTMTARSEINKGTTFTITLPIKN